mmetsp:Transcript_35/g.64  ORF Transcript_35/g.64 Transcript_35/m.64 type:complete len:86 (+) Transcript_35:113-370(+)
MIRHSASMQSPRIPFMLKGAFDMNDNFSNGLEQMSLGDNNRGSTSLSSPKYRNNTGADGGASETVWSVMSSLYAHASESLDDKAA